MLHVPYLGCTQVCLFSATRPRHRAELRVAAPRGRPDLSSATARRSEGHSDANECRRATLLPTGHPPADRPGAEAVSAGSLASSLL